MHLRPAALCAAFVFLLPGPSSADLFFLSEAGADATSTLHIEWTDGFKITYDVSYDSATTSSGHDLLDLVVSLSAGDALVPDLTYGLDTFGSVATLTAVEPSGPTHTDTPVFGTEPEGPYWGYFVTGGTYSTGAPIAGPPLPWEFSSFGIDGRFVGDGSYDGWRVTSGFGVPFGFDPAPPGLPAAVPEPSAILLVGIVGGVLTARRRWKALHVAA